MAEYSKLRRALRLEQEKLKKNAAAVRKHRRRLFELNADLKTNEEELRATAGKIGVALRAMEAAEHPNKTGWARLASGGRESESVKLRRQAKAFAALVEQRHANEPSRGREGIAKQLKSLLARAAAFAPAKAKREVRCRLSTTTRRDLEKLLDQTTPPATREDFRASLNQARGQGM